MPPLPPRRANVARPLPHPGPRRHHRAHQRPPPRLPQARHGAKEVDSEEFAPTGTWVAAREVTSLAPGAFVEIDPDAEDLAYPTSFATIPPGDYQVQVVLDVDHTYNYSGRTHENWITAVLALPHWNPANAVTSTLQLTEHPTLPPAATAALTKAMAAAVPGVAQLEKFQSPALTKFWGRPTFIQAWVILPPGYFENPGEKYPTVFWTHGFGGELRGALINGLRYRERMVAGTMPPMIYVMLDESIPQGTHEFADSVNNGPWGTALTTEFIPALEKTYRMDATANSRLLTGHSSGGWATLQLQINYPTLFGGTWSTSPDPADFHNFTNIDLYRPNANAYNRADGTPTPLMRDHAKLIATFQQFSQLERVLGPYGGQNASFDWVFSPKSPSGAPMQFFDRTTGVIDPVVAQYWHDHYDLAHIVESTWPQRGPLLKGRIHLIVGTADTFYLDGAAHLFEARLNKLGAEPHFTYISDRTHFDLYLIDKDPRALSDKIAIEMYAVARPKSNWKPRSSPSPAASAQPGK